MGKSKKTEVSARPPLPSAEEILSDVKKASDDDPAFAPVSDTGIFDNGNSAEGKHSSESMIDPGVRDRSDELEDANIDGYYNKVCDLLDMLSSMRNGKDQLENSCHHLLSSKEEVSAVALQLKTRLEKHKLLSSQPMK